MSASGCHLQISKKCGARDVGRVRRHAVVKADAAHRLGCDLALTSELPTPATDARQSDSEAFDCFVSLRAGLDRMNHALTQVDGQG